MENENLQLVNLSDEGTFERVFKNHYSQLASFAFQYVRNDETAEEIVQEMFSNLWANHEKISIRTSLKSYLYGAVRNACLNYLKHEKVKQAHADYHLRTHSQLDGSDFLELDELKERIDQAMEGIPEKCRVIFEKSRYEGKKYQEIADELSLSIKTVENQMGKALKILREELKDYLILIVWFMVHGGKF